MPVTGIWDNVTQASQTLLYDRQSFRPKANAKGGSVELFS